MYKQKMKILYIFFHSFHDMPYHTREWVEAAMNLGHEVKVITALDPGFLKFIDWDKKAKVKQVDYSGSGIINYRKLLRNFKTAIADSLDEFNPEIVYERFSTISPATANIMQEREIPYFVEINGIITEELKLSKSSFLRRLYFQWLQKYVLKRATSTIAVTDEIKQWLVKQLKLPDAKITTIPNGVNINRFKKYSQASSRGKFDLDKNAFIVGFLGSLFPWCGLDILIKNAPKIIEHVPNIKFLIGGGQEPVKSELIKKVKKENIADYFIFKGQISWEDAPEFISTFDVGIETRINTTNTSFSPLKIYAYMACNIPIICSDLPNLKKIIEKTGCGILYQDDESLVNAVITMQKNKTQSQSDKMGSKARKYVENYCSWEKRIKDTFEGQNKDG